MGTRGSAAAAGCIALAGKSVQALGLVKMLVPLTSEAQEYFRELRLSLSEELRNSFLGLRGKHPKTPDLSSIS
jgi:hypothetical protein